MSWPCSRKALESLGIPCFLGGMSRGMLGKDSPLHIRQNRRDALKEADLVLLAGKEQQDFFWYFADIPRSDEMFVVIILIWFLTGTVCDFRMSYGRVLNRRSKIIAVNRDKTQLLKNSDLFWKPTVAIQGEAISRSWLMPKWLISCLLYTRFHCLLEAHRRSI